MGKPKTEKKPTAERIYSREALLKSKRFSYVQRDFLKAILNKDSYTMAEAEKAVKNIIGDDK